MEKLSEIPTKNDTQMSQDEESVMKKYFKPESFAAVKTSSGGWMDTIKLAMYASVLFLILANPWIDSILCMVPYCGENVLVLLAFKALLFMILFVCTFKFLVS